MESNWVLHAGMALAVGGFFAATWWAQRRPAARGRERVDPQLDADSDSRALPADGAGRRPPQA